MEICSKEQRVQGVYHILSKVKKYFFSLSKSKRDLESNETDELLYTVREMSVVRFHQYSIE